MDREIPLDKDEQIVNKLHEADVLIAQGMPVKQMCKQIGVTDKMYYRWRFVQARTHGGRAFRMLTVIDEYTRECLAIDVARKLRSDDVLERLAWLMATRGVPEHIRSDNGTEFTAKAVRNWLGQVGLKTLYIEPGSPWENGYIESFNGKPRDELLSGEIFYSLKEAKVLIERWRVHYNTVRPHSSLRYRPPAPQAAISEACSATLRTPLTLQIQGQCVT